MITTGTLIIRYTILYQFSYMKCIIVIALLSQLLRFAAQLLLGYCMFYLTIHQPMPVVRLNNLVLRSVNICWIMAHYLLCQMLNITSYQENIMFLLICMILQNLYNFSIIGTVNNSSSPVVLVGCSQVLCY